MEGDRKRVVSYGMAKVTLAGITVKSRIALAKDVGWVAEEITSGLLPFSYPSITFAFSGTNYSADTLDKQEWYTITPDAFLYITTPAGQPPVWKPVNTGPPGTPRFQTLIDSGVMHTWLPAPIAEHAASLFVPPAIWNQTVYGYAVPCTAQVPQLAVKINGMILPWHKKDIITDDFTGEGGCVSGINNGRQYSPYTMGDTWMMSNLVVFDVGANKVRVRSSWEY